MSGGANPLRNLAPLTDCLSPSEFA